MTQLQKDLQQQLSSQRHIWGHIQPDRWQAVLAYAEGTILDVGCANGVYVKRLLDEQRDAYGIDLLRYPEWVALPHRLAIADATALPHPDNSFDTIISFETLEHIPNVETALREYRRVCRKNIIVSVPNCETPDELRDGGLTYHHWTDRTHVNLFTHDTLTQALMQAGFRIRHSAYINRILPAVPLLCAFGIPLRPARGIARLLRRISPKQFPMTLLAVGEKV
ncbi:MAG: class I SAM-dependent methyltransferase [Chloroflexi bacterium]|nr:class I SAM-dependent methyltransferase [Chloroflexota bacterium]